MHFSFPLSALDFLNVKSISTKRLKITINQAIRKNPIDNGWRLLHLEWLMIFQLMNFAIMILSFMNLQLHGINYIKKGTSVRQKWKLEHFNKWSYVKDKGCCHFIFRLNLPKSKLPLFVYPETWNLAKPQTFYLFIVLQ